jgi:ATP dependent helicase, Lhr family
MIKEMTALVRKSNAKKSIVPSWTGGRMPLSANLGKKLRQVLDFTAKHHKETRASEITAWRRFSTYKDNSLMFPGKTNYLLSILKQKMGFTFLCTHLKAGWYMKLWQPFLPGVSAASGP